MTAILILLLLILLNGLFSMSEMAMDTARKEPPEISATKGYPSDKIALHVQEKPGKMISTVQTGITRTGLFTGINSGQQIGYAVRPYCFQVESAEMDKKNK